VPCPQSRCDKIVLGFRKTTGGPPLSSHESGHRHLKAARKSAVETPVELGMGRAFGAFIAHSLLATVGCFVGAFTIGFMVAGLIALWSSGPGNIVDRAVDSWFFRYCVDNPYFLLPIFFSFCLGSIVFRFSKHSSAAWAWVLPGTILLLNILPSMSDRSGQGIIQNYFGRDCGSNECLDQLLFTAPFYTSVAYSLGWLSRRWLSAR